jgi:uncharacterized protein (TIGR00251 family)
MSEEKHSVKLHGGKTGAAITVKVTPRSSRNEVVGILEDGTVKIKLTAAPVEGLANKALVEFLAEVLDIAKSKIEIIGGMTGRNKLVTILDLDPETVQKRIFDHLV